MNSTETEKKTFLKNTEKKRKIEFSMYLLIKPKSVPCPPIDGTNIHKCVQEKERKTCVLLNIQRFASDINNWLRSNKQNVKRLMETVS